MKSKSFDLKQNKPEKAKYNKTFDFIGFYKSAAETNNNVDKNKPLEGINKENNFKPPTLETPKRRHSKKKKNHKNKNDYLDISQVNNNEHSLDASLNNNNSVITAKTSTPCTKTAVNQAKVKSIMKNSSVTSDDTMDGSDHSPPQIKPKKRNKSVSFMLEDHEEVAMKKTKSDDSLRIKNKSDSNMEKNSTKDDKKLKSKKSNQAEKENKSDESNISMECDQTEIRSTDKKGKIDKVKASSSNVIESTSDSQYLSSPDIKKKYKKVKKQKKTEDTSETIDSENTSNDNQSEIKDKKSKKKKRLAKSSPTDTSETEGEPKKKSRKTEIKPEAIAKDLGNLSIGDNAHTLSNLLDEMSVVDKSKKKKNRTKTKKDKKQKAPSTSSSETADLEKIVEGKEKIKWKKRKWNKEKKGETEPDASVVIENLPVTVMLTYKALLSTHFSKCGAIKKIGVAEFYPAGEMRPVFTTSITFQNTEAVEKALEEDNTLFEGNRIRVKRPLPPTETTIVVRSFGELSVPTLTSVFAVVGKIRCIRHAVKGKKSIVTAFIEFDGPESVEKALKMSEDAKIGGKKIHVSKYEQRSSKHKQRENKRNDESENEGDSENSND